MGTVPPAGCCNAALFAWPAAAPARGGATAAPRPMGRPCLRRAGGAWAWTPCFTHRQRVVVLVDVLLGHLQRVVVDVHPNHVLRPKHGSPDAQHCLQDGKTAGGRMHSVAPRQLPAMSGALECLAGMKAGRIAGGWSRTVPHPRSITVCPSNSS